MSNRRVGCFLRNELGMLVTFHCYFFWLWLDGHDIYGLIGQAYLVLSVWNLLVCENELIMMLCFNQLYVECIFCSACIRFVQCCPPEGLTGLAVPLLIYLCKLSYFVLSQDMLTVITEKLWIGLEQFVFDWLINADR